MFMSDDLSVHEEFVRSVKRRIAGAIGSVFEVDFQAKRNQRLNRTDHGIWLGEVMF